MGKADKSKALDLTSAARGVWLIKIPNYLSDVWKATNQEEAGVMSITVGEKTEISFDLNPKLVEDQQRTASGPSVGGGPSRAGELAAEGGGAKKTGLPEVPLHHKVHMQTFEGQSMFIFSEGDGSGLAAEGKVMQKAEIQPHQNSKAYLELKKQQMAVAQEPKHQVRQISSTVRGFKPVARHKEHVEHEKQVKERGRRARDDREVVLDLIFAAFQQHQYYSFSDLVHKTKQPPGYLKEILREVCVYNTKNPHKNMWELKPEFRHYQKQDQ